MTRKANSRITDTSMIERNERWAKEARDWVRAQLESIILPDTPDVTVADVMSTLDRREPLPMGYVRILDSKLYPNRYQMVRNVLDEMRRDGTLETGTTVNAKGLDGSTCYRRVRPATFQVEAMGSAAEGIQTMLQQWFDAQGPRLAGLDGLMVTRVGSTPASGGAVNAVQATAIKRTAKAS